MGWKKRVAVSIMILSIFLLALLYKLEVKSALVLYVDENQNTLLQVKNGDVTISPWEQDGIIYYFLPSYVKEDEIVVRSEDNVVAIDGRKISGIHTFSFDIEKEYVIDMESDKAICQKKLIFMKSRNLNTVFLTLDSGDTSVIDDIKEAKEPGEIKLISETGRMENWERLESISCRGNSSFGADKKSYTIKLEEPHSLCGMAEAKKWLLLANVYEGTHMMNKMTYDMASKIGLEYTSDSDWVDVYVDGEYKGNYLLCEKIEVGENRVNIHNLSKENEQLNPGEPLPYEEEDNKGYVLPNNPSDITGGYLLEKDSNYFYDEEESGFLTEDDNAFTIHSPGEPSEEEVDYIRQYIQNIEDELEEEDSKVLDYIDLDSFSKRYIIEELTKNADAWKTSTYFYKEIDDEKLYVGPVWDYDGGYGEEDVWTDWDGSVLQDEETRSGGSTILDWFEELLEYPEYRDAVVMNYMNYKPILEDMLEHQIDNYADQIRYSMRMDCARWDYATYGAGHYESFDNNIRFLKYFLKARLDFLNDMYELPMETYEIPVTDEAHCVHFIYKEDENIIWEDTLEIKDGDVLKEEDIPVIEHVSWNFERDGESFMNWIPIYEDMTVVGESDVED